jgi:RimJ/RimL family protein N-acetyltransferase
MKILDTERLTLRHLSTDDAAFIVELLNDPSFIRNIGDKGVRTQNDARRYIETGPRESYARFGFGVYRVEITQTGEPIGMCGLVKRDSLADPDIGFAFLPRFRSKGYAFESAAAVMRHARETLGIARVVAIVSPDNSGSIKVLEKLGLRFERMIQVSEDQPPIQLFV